MAFIPRTIRGKRLRRPCWRRTRYLLSRVANGMTLYILSDPYQQEPFGFVLGRCSFAAVGEVVTLLHFRPTPSTTASPSKALHPCACTLNSNNKPTMRWCSDATTDKEIRIELIASHIFFQSWRTQDFTLIVQTVAL